MRNALFQKSIFPRPFSMGVNFLVTIAADCHPLVSGIEPLTNSASSMMDLLSRFGLADFAPRVSEQPAPAQASVFAQLDGPAARPRP
jgi:hypothetical protein